MKNSLKYIVLIIIFITCVVSITLSYLHTHYKEMGSIKVTKKYYDIMFDNAIIDNNSTSIKIDNDKDSLHIEIPEFKNDVEFSLDVKNIGNVDVLLDSISYTNVVTNMDKTKVKVITSLEKNDIIRGGDEKKLVVKITSDGVNIEDPHYNFNIDCIFKEVSI